MAVGRAFIDLAGVLHLINIAPLDISKVWLCAACGSKVIHCQRVSQPRYQCFCGGKEWSPVHDGR